VAARRGSALALSVLPYEFLIVDWRIILKTLCAACLVPVRLCDVKISVSLYYFCARGLAYLDFLVMLMPML
jgi:hypothetical protein